MPPISRWALRRPTRVAPAIFGQQDVRPVQSGDELTADELPQTEEEALQEIEDWEVEDEDAEATTGAGEELRGPRPARARRRRGAQGPAACHTVPDRRLGRAATSPMA